MADVPSREFFMSPNPWLEVTLLRAAGQELLAAG
jgi:hypothetical protein